MNNIELFLLGLASFIFGAFISFIGGTSGINGALHAYFGIGGAVVMIIAPIRFIYQRWLE